MPLPVCYPLPNGPMLNLILTAALVVSGPLQEPAEDAPDPQLIEEAVKELKQAFTKGKTPERLEALKDYGAVNDAKVIDWIAKGLKARDTAVQSASIECLRWLEHPDALDCLHTSLAKDKKLKKDDALYEQLIKAVGQHHNPKSIDFLLDGALAQAAKKVQVARIYSLGNIRDKESVEALMDVMQRTASGGKKGRGKQPLMTEIDISLQMLTGEEFGRDEAAWLKWWRASKKEFEVSPKVGQVRPKVRKVWGKYWGLAKADAAGKKGRDGKDGEDGEDGGEGRRKKKGD